MATVQEVRESIETIIGNRKDLSDTIIICINDALKLVAGTHITPTHIVMCYKNITLESVSLMSDDEVPVQLMETVSAVSIYNGGDYDAEPLPPGRFVPMEKGNLERLLVQPEPALPEKWAIVGDQSNTPQLFVSPPPDKTYTLRIIGPRTFPTLADGAQIYVPDVLIPIVRMTALGMVKTILGQVEDAGVIMGWARAFGKAIDVQGHSEQHGSFGLRVRTH